MRAPQLLFSILLASCSADTLDLEGNPIDGGNGQSADAETDPRKIRYCEDGPARIPAGLHYSADGCNECECDPGLDGNFCEGNVCTGLCTGAFCPNPMPTCTRSADCGGGTYGLCYFEPGCDNPVGSCVGVQPQCSPGVPPLADGPLSDDEPAFCGCDGKTYASFCPTIPYRHGGPCEAP